MKNRITPAMIELRSAITEAQAITAKPEVSKREEVRVNVLLAKVAALRQSALAPDDFSKRWMFAFMTGATLPELRNDLLAGQQTISYTEGGIGGYLVPQEFHNELFLGISKNDPLLDENLV